MNPFPGTYKVSDYKYNPTEDTFDLTWESVDDPENQWYWCSVEATQLGLPANTSEEELRALTMEIKIS